VWRLPKELVIRRDISSLIRSQYTDLLYTTSGFNKGCLLDTVQKLVHMYVNTKVIPVETIPGMV
jgi:hypothetical protein